jgi:predicted GH43/DUF377 family glycosyl hydrolase
VRLWTIVIILASGCGGGDSSPDAAGDGTGSDGTNNCAPIGAQGQFTRRANNPRYLPGATYTDGKIDISISDPDVYWDGSKYQLYFMAGHATSFSATDLVQVIRHASSVDRVTWTIDDSPVFTVSPDAGAWDRTHAETPTVVYNPAAPADRRYLMMYSGASGTFPHPGYTFSNYAIGAAFSADGITFTRVPASESPHGKAGLVLTGKQAYPASTDGLVSDPELALVNGVYHLWFSSFACTGTSCETTTDFGIGHATSTDGVHWTVLEAPVRSLLRASADTKTGGQQPSVVYDAAHCRYEMWLTSDVGTENDAQPIEFNNMMGVYKGESTDGITWSLNYTRARDLQWSQTEAGEHLGLLTGADVAQNSTGRLMLYVGFDDQNVPSGFFLPDRTMTGFRSGVMTLQVATRDLP